MRLIPRHIRPIIVDALSHARVVCLLGARQSGKTTLVRSIAEEEHPSRYVSLDDPGALDLARADPMGFVAGGERLAIDEVQRAPELLLAIKRVVDADDARGRFLLTGSANIMTHPRVADALPGRVRYLTLWPLSQRELGGPRGSFLESVFAGRPPEVESPPEGRAAYADAVVRGGFPEALELSTAERNRFFADYASSILGREIDELASVRDTEASARVLQLLAARSGALTNFSAIGRELGIDYKTVGNHLRALEQLFLIRRLPAWHPNLGHRVIRSARLHLADSGMLASLIGSDADRLERDGGIAGSAFETFVVGEVIRQASVSELDPLLTFHHYRDRRGNEVDLVIEHANGDIVAIEIKASATPRLRDISGLQLLRDRLGERFRLGLLLHLGPDTVPMGDRISAVPLAGLWTD